MYVGVPQTAYRGLSAIVARPKSPSFSVLLPSGRSCTCAAYTNDYYCWELQSFIRDSNLSCRQTFSSPFGIPSILVFAPPEAETSEKISTTSPHSAKYRPTGCLKCRLGYSCRQIPRYVLKLKKWQGIVLLLWNANTKLLAIHCRWPSVTFKIALLTLTRCLYFPAGCTTCCTTGWMNYMYANNPGQAALERAS